MFFMFIAEGVCTPQGVWIRAIGRTVNSFTGRHSELRNKSPKGYKRLRGFICFFPQINYWEILKSKTIMQLILSKSTEALTGSLGRGFGYHIQRRKNGFFAKRNAKGDVPADGHLRFILACAELAQNGLHIADIAVSAEELRAALREAGRVYDDDLRQAEASQRYNAAQVLQFKKRWNL